MNHAGGSHEPSIYVLMHLRSRLEIIILPHHHFTFLGRDVPLPGSALKKK